MLHTNKAKKNVLAAKKGSCKDDIWKINSYIWNGSVCDGVKIGINTFYHFKEFFMMVKNCEMPTILKSSIFVKISKTCTVKAWWNKGFRRYLK